MSDVWVVEDLEHGETHVYPGDTNLLEVEWIKQELSYLVGGYDEEREEFISAFIGAQKRGRGYAHIEERIDAELKSMAS